LVVELRALDSDEGSTAATATASRGDEQFEKAAILQRQTPVGVLRIEIA
jgi:hypothetical protein